MDFQKLRKEYENSGIDASALPPCPLTCFRQWLELAVANGPGDWFETNAMSLATSDQRGNVSVRVVLLKGITESGIQFFTNYESDKGQQLAINPHAAVVFHWPYLGRQVRMEGTVEKTTAEVSNEYFHSRPRGSQIGAVASAQSQPVETREELDQAAKETEARLEGRKVPRPENWGGYLLTPQRVEFWQGRTDRLHDRIVYQQRPAGNPDEQGFQWDRVRLSP